MKAILDPASSKLLQFGLIGLVMAGALVTAFEFRPAAIFPVNGTLVVKITDVPLDFASPDSLCGDCDVTSLNVTIDSVRVHRTGALNLTGEWIEVLSGTRTLDIILLQDATQVLGSVGVPQSMITSVRLHVASAVAKLSGSGQVVSLEVPSDELKMALGSIVQVKGGMTTVIVIDFQPHVVCQGNSQCRLTPVLGLKSAKGPM